ncbi:hypothetical protein P3S68_014452 [Capsicum galapagoense]
MNQAISHLLQTCKTLNRLKSVHVRLLVCGSTASSDLVLNKIILLYSCSGAADYARNMFDEITERNPFVWTSMIHGYVEILSIRKPFLSSGICVSEIIISSILKAFGRLKWSRDGEAVFGFIWKCGFGFDLIVLNSVIDCFMRCGEVDCARRVCDEM